MGPFICFAQGQNLCQLRSPRGGRLDGFYFCLSFRRVYFWARKKSSVRHRKYGPLQFKIPATDAVCVKVASSLTFCAHSSLQSFSTSDKMKGPKTGPPGGTTFDPKRVHFWVPSEIYLLCARVQNWALSILNLVPPWGLV